MTKEQSIELRRALFRWSADNAMPRIATGGYSTDFAYGGQYIGERSLRIEFYGERDKYAVEARIFDEHMQCGDSRREAITTTERLIELLNWVNEDLPKQA